LQEEVVVVPPELVVRLLVAEIDRLPAPEEEDEEVLAPALAVV
jgi:hypothetical protein